MHELALDVLLLAGSAVLILAIVAVRFSHLLGLPSLLVYLAIGLVLDETGLFGHFQDADLALALGLSALVLILAEGGLSTRWDEVRPAMGLGLLLATLGAATSVAVVAVVAHHLLGLDWQLALLLAAVTSPTDAAAVFSVLRSVPLRRRVAGVLEAESGLNDAPMVVLVVALSAGDLGAQHPLVTAALIAGELVLGGLVGAVVGLLGGRTLRGLALPASGLYPLAVLAFTVLSYGLATVAHGSGFAAVYVAALVLGNTELPHRAATRSFAEGVGWLAQIGLFVMLGLLADPLTIEWWHAGTALAAGLVLVLVARPLSVVVCATWFRRPLGEQLFVSWAGLRGAVPVILATIPLAAGVPGAHDLFNIVLVFVIGSTLVQALPLGWLARRTGVLGDDARDLEVEAAPLERIAADLMLVHVPPGSRLAGVEVGELRLPVGASVTLVVRDGESLVPHRTTRLRTDDDVLVVVSRGVRARTETRLRAVARHGRLAGWDPDR